MLKEDPTNTRLDSLQSYLRKLLKEGEISETIYDQIRPMNAKIARAHGLPKVHKDFERIPPFRPIIDTIGSTHSLVGKYLTNLLHPLTQNSYSIKDSFEAASRIENIPKHLLNDEDYILVSLDVVSLFTNVPLNRTVKVILDRVYKEKLIDTTLSKRVLKKLIIDTCRKTAFMFDNKIYEQIDGVSMGASLGPVLSNIIMTECEKKIVNKFINQNIIRFYIRYVDDTLLLVKKDQLDKVLKAFNKFDRGLKFTVDTFDNCLPHFLDLEICPNGISIFRKNTHTGQYVNYTSVTPWKWKVAWIRSLTQRAVKICNSSNLSKEIKSIKNFAAWNAFPKHIVNGIIKRITSKTSRKVNPVNDDVLKIYLNISYPDQKGEQLIKNCAKKLKRFSKKKFVFVPLYSVTKMSFFTNMKDKLPFLSKSNVVYRFTCPGCSSAYIGKTDRTLFIRTKEHATRQDHTVKQHIDNCSNVEHLFNMFNVFNDDVNKRQFLIQLVRDHTSIIDQANNWNVLLYKEALHIKQKNPILNNGLKGSRELQLFK